MNPEFVKDADVKEVIPFPEYWTQYEPNFSPPSLREYSGHAPLLEYAETIYNKYHCVVELYPHGYRFGYVGVRETHPAYKKAANAIPSSVHGGIEAVTHQAFIFRSPDIRMWYYVVTTFNQEENYPDVYALEKYQDYWSKDSVATKYLKELIENNFQSPGLLKGPGLHFIRDLNFVKEQLVKLVLELEEYEKDIHKP